MHSTDTVSSLLDVYISVIYFLFAVSFLMFCYQQWNAGTKATADDITEKASVSQVYTVNHGEMEADVLLNLQQVYMSAIRNDYSIVHDIVIVGAGGSTTSLRDRILQSRLHQYPVPAGTSASAHMAKLSADLTTPYGETEMSLIYNVVSAAGTSFRKEDRFVQKTRTATDGREIPDGGILSEVRFIAQ